MNLWETDDDIFMRNTVHGNLSSTKITLNKTLKCLKQNLMFEQFINNLVKI